MSEKEPKATPDIPPEQEQPGTVPAGPLGRAAPPPEGDGCDPLRSWGPAPRDFVGLGARRLGELLIPEGSGTGTG